MRTFDLIDSFGLQQFKGISSGCKFPILWAVHFNGYKESLLDGFAGFENPTPQVLVSFNTGRVVNCQ